MSEQQFSAAAYKDRRKTYEVTLPSGFVFTLRRPNMSLYVTGGTLPSSMLEKIIEAENKGGDFQKAFSTLPAKEQMNALKFSGQLVRDACVLPRIVDEPKDETEIRFEDLDDADFLFILNWAKGGGERGESLTNFRVDAATAGSGDNGGTVSQPAVEAT